MPASTPMPYQDEEQDSATLRWIVLFVVLSLLAHALLLVILVFLSKHIPPPRLEAATVTPTTSITLIQPPQVAPKKIFMPTPDDQKNAPHKDTRVESDHDTRVASKSKTSRKPDSIMPDVVSKDTHATSLQASQASPPTPKAQSQTTPPAPKPDQAKPQPPTPPQPQQPPEPKAEKPTPPSPMKTPPPPKPAPTPPKTPPPPAVDENGLPVLPMLNAPTLAPQTSATTAQQQQVATTPPVPQIVPANMEGMAGISGQPSPEAMKTDLGAYKARFYAAVGSRWYAKLTPMQIQMIGIGRVHIQYTITPDGVISTKVLDSGGSSMQSLLTISQNSLRETSPFLKFPASMLKKYPNGYTDDFWFSIYGG